MNQKKSLILIATVGILLIVGAYFLYHNLGDKYGTSQLATLPQHTEPTTTAIDDQTTTGNSVMPDFTVYDIQGIPYRLSDFKGKPVVLNFWASWCGPCKSEMPDFETAYQKYGNKIHFLMVNMTDGAQETVQSASGFISDIGYTFPVYYDTDSDAAMTYGVASIPTTFFIDTDGNGVAWASGALSMDMLEQGIGMIYTP